MQVECHINFTGYMKFAEECRHKGNSSRDAKQYYEAPCKLLVGL
jgi:hypothetical protein